MSDSASTRDTALNRVSVWVRLFDNDATTSRFARDSMRTTPPQVSLRAVAAIAAIVGAIGDMRSINALALDCETHALTWSEIDDAAS